MQKFIKNGGKTKADISSEDYKPIPIGKRPSNSISSKPNNNEYAPLISDYLCLESSKNRPSSTTKSKEDSSSNLNKPQFKNSLKETKGCTGGSSSKEAVNTQKCKIKLNNTYEHSEIGTVLNQISPKSKIGVHQSFSINENSLFEGTAPVSGCSYFKLENYMKISPLLRFKFLYLPKGLIRFQK